MSTVVINGFFVGLVYGLLAVGLVVVYRGSRIINFAYGETGMIGAFVFSELWATHHLPLVFAIVSLGRLAVETPSEERVAFVALAGSVIGEVERSWPIWVTEKSPMRQPPFRSEIIKGPGIRG